MGSACRKNKNRNEMISLPLPNKIDNNDNENKEISKEVDKEVLTSKYHSLISEEEVIL